VNPDADDSVKGNVDYVPTYELPQLFRWQGYWLEIKRNKGSSASSQFGGAAPGTIFVTWVPPEMSSSLGA
jgi:chaperone BCS1